MAKKLTYLIPALAERTELQGKYQLKIRTGEALSFLSKDLQNVVEYCICRTGRLPDMETAKRWKRICEDLSEEDIGRLITTGILLIIAANLNDEIAMFPTPKAQNSRGAGEKHGKGGISLDVEVGGQLNPDWVEWLVGLPFGWTDPEKEVDKSTMSKTGHWLPEPDIPRVAVGVKDRVNRLKCLGNIAVPQQFYPVCRAIAEIEMEMEMEK